VDIIVTTPKDRMAEAAREAEEIIEAGGGWYYRDYRTPRIPRVDIGDRVYYVEDGYIRGFAVVAGVERVRDHDTGKVLAVRIMMDAKSWTWIEPIPWKAPRSFQYVLSVPRWHYIKIVGGWLDPKPAAPLEK